MKKYYTRRWIYLDNLYNELSLCNKELEENYDDDLVNYKLFLLKEIKLFLRYNTPSEDFIS